MEYKVVSVDYFMDKMQLYEIPLLTENLNYADKNLLVTQRLLIQQVVQKFVKKQIKSTDIYELPWDGNAGIEVSAEQDEKIREHQQMIADFLNKNTN